METVVITGGALITEEMNHSGDFLFPVLKLEEANYKDLLGGRGLRYLTEATKMALVAAKMAKENAKVEDLVPERSGVVVATNLSSMSTIVDFDYLTLTEGPRAVGAMQGPNLVLNATAAKLGIHFNITGFNTTISTGRVASLDALEYAYHMIQKQEVDLVIMTGVEEWTPTYKKWLEETNLMSAEQLNQFRQLGGTIILESESHAQARGAKIYGQIVDFSSTFAPALLAGGGVELESRLEYSYLIDDLAKDRDKISTVCVADSHLDTSHQERDTYFRKCFEQAELIAIGDVFGGDLFGSTGVAQVLCSLQKFQGGNGLIFCHDEGGNFRGLLLKSSQLAHKGEKL